jgi:hypothetical protein
MDQKDQNAGQGPTSQAVPANGPKPEKLLSFNPYAIDVQWVDNRWQLVADGVWLKEFRRESDAREALRVLRRLGINQRGTIGTPLPVLEYWLSDGQVPRGTSFGLHVLPIDLASLRVEQVQGQWVIRDAYRLLFVFGSHGAEAKEALDIIRRHEFTKIGYVGQPAPELIYFLGGPGHSSVSHQKPPQRPAPEGTALANPPSNPPSAPPATNPAEVQRARQLAAIAALAADHPNLGDRVSFDPRQLRVQQDHQDWKLTYGEYTIANFGPYPELARLGLNVLQFYHCNEHCLVGQPHPVFSFFLANGQPPRGLMFGLGGVPFRPEALSIREVGGAWAICDNERPIFPFGDRLDEAKMLLQIIRQQKFNRLCRIGPENPGGMTLLIRTH